jgi:transcriptional regulator with XRE-family HTH domain
MGLSQLEVSSMTGVGRTYISLYENNRMIPRNEHWGMLQEALLLPYVNASGSPGRVSVVPNGDIENVRLRVTERLTEAPQGLLWGYDEEFLEQIEAEVLVDVLRLVVLEDAANGRPPLIPHENSEGSVGQALKEKLMCLKLCSDGTQGRNKLKITTGKLVFLLSRTLSR